jgi:hypothetical protein
MNELSADTRNISHYSNKSQQEKQYGNSPECTPLLLKIDHVSVKKEGEEFCEEDALALTTVWERKCRWSRAADELKKTLNFYEKSHLSLIVSGAFLQTLAAYLASTSSTYGWAVSLLGAGCVGAAPFISSHFLTEERYSDWISCRATSEAIKAEVFLFRAGVPPYDDKSAADTSKVRVLFTKLADISEVVKDLDYLCVMPTPLDDNNPSSPPPKLDRGDDKKPSKPPLKLDRGNYMKYRLDQQIGFYSKKALATEKRSSNLKKCQYMTAAGSSAIGILASLSAGGAVDTTVGGDGCSSVFNNLQSNVGIWGAAFATASVAFGTYIKAGKYDEMVVEWRAVAQRLDNLFLRLPEAAGPGSQEWIDFVLKCEEMIASNTKKWANKLQEK